MSNVEIQIDLEKYDLYAFPYTAIQIIYRDESGEKFAAAVPEDSILVFLEPKEKSENDPR